MTRTEPDRLGWENVGVERDVGRVRRWALPVQVAQAWQWRGRDMLEMIAEIARQSAAHADETVAVVNPWDEWVPRIPRAGMMSITWAHRPSPDWTVPRD